MIKTSASPSSPCLTPYHTAVVSADTATSSRANAARTAVPTSGNHRQWGHSTHAVHHSAGAAVRPGASGCARRARPGPRHPGHTALAACSRASCLARPVVVCCLSPGARPVRQTLEAQEPRRDRADQRLASGSGAAGAPGGAGRKGHALACAPAGAGWHRVDGRGRWKRPFEFPILILSSALAPA